MDENTVNSLKTKVAQACRVLAKIGLVDWLGHVSAKIPGETAMVIKGHGFDAGDMRKTSTKHMLILDFEGNVLDGNLEKPFEWPLHTCIYQARPDVGSVIHTHQIMATALTIAGKTILPVWHARLAAPVATPPPVFDDASLIMTTDIADELAKTLGNHSVCLIRGHGVVTVGGSPEEAALTAIYLEKQAELNYMALQVGKPKPLSERELDLKSTGKRNIQGRWAYFAGLDEDKL